MINCLVIATKAVLLPDYLIHKQENVSRASETLQGLRRYQSSCRRSKSSLETVNNGGKLTKLAQGGRERGRERENRMTQGEIKSSY